MFVNPTLAQPQNFHMQHVGSTNSHNYNCMNEPFLKNNGGQICCDDLRYWTVIY